MAETMHCTKENPMPDNRDQMGQHWIHHDVEETADLDMYGVAYKCNSCGLEFVAKDVL
jgi:hypothetical protein